MKKVFKVSSLVLTFLMIMISFAQVSVLAANGDPRLTVGGDDSYDINIGVSDATELGVSETKYVYASGISDVTRGVWSVNKGNILIYKFLMPELSAGKKIDKFILRFSHTSTGDKGWVFKKVPGTDITGITTAAINNYDAANDSAFVDNWQKTFSSTAAYTVNIVTVDVSSYVQECYRAGQEYFYIAVYNSSTRQIWSSTYTEMNSESGYNSDDAKPYGYYTEADVDELTYLSVTKPESPEDGVSFVFSNPVKSSSVSASNFAVTSLSGDVEVFDEEITVSGSTITLNKAWEECEYYTVILNGTIADVYGQNLEVSCTTSFEMPAVCTEIAAAALPTFGIQSDGTIKDGSESYNKINAKNSYVLYKFDLSAIDKTKTVVAADFQWTAQSSGVTSIKVLMVPNGTWTDASSIATDIANDYYTAVDEAAQAGSVYETSVDFGSSYTYATHHADVSGAVSNALSNTLDSNYITFALTFNKTYNCYTNNALNIEKPQLRITLAEPSFGAVDASPAKNGVMDGVNAPIELTMATTIADEYLTNDYIQLIKADDESTANISIKANGSKLIITPANDLDERTEYKIVLKSGITDIFGNVLTSDRVISSFISGTALEFFEIKYTLDKSPVYDTVEEISSYNAGDEVTSVAKFKNNSGTDLDAVMLIALYDSSNSIIAVDVAGGTACAPANQETQFAKTITVPSDAADTYIKAFIWSDLVDIRPICRDACIDQAK